MSEYRLFKVIRTDGQKYFDIEYVRDVVMCKDCRWGKPYSDKQLECDALGLGGLKFPDDFCSYGVKKGADDE